ncbi:recombinase family protein [Lysobacter panacisoli]|uniref:Recombinase family protein n=1 Tax=Lysobacter panacisoli TaxID=1255263 RepID=A0ABP9LGI5_9GAMM
MRTAAYARYSSDQQRAASLEDQLRNCRAYCERQGWPEPTIYTDAAISGARLDRPGYRALLAKAERYDVILVDDLSRLSRDSVEAQRQVKRLTFAGVRLIGVSDGVDTARKGHTAEVGLRGIMGELYLDDLREKTHRGLTGRALAGASAGGLPYGYTVTSVGQRAIDEAQANVVRRIFAEFIDGLSPRAIAAGLNRDGIPSSRGSSWAMTAIHGDLRRGIGILANPIYVGRQVWNRSRWIKHPDTGRRVRQERPCEEWVTTEHPELAIIDLATWCAAQARMGVRGKDSGKPGPGRPPRHLLSGLLRCGECGGPMVVVDKYNYACSIARDRGTCASKVRLRRVVAEERLLAGIREEILTEEAFQRFEQVTAIALKSAGPNLDAAKRRVAEAERIRENVMRAIKAGVLTPSTKSELIASERAVQDAEIALRHARQLQPEQILPRARETWHRLTTSLADSARDVPAARAAVRELLGAHARVINKNGDLFAEIAVPSDASNVVAGAGFEPATFGL